MYSKGLLTHGTALIGISAVVYDGASVDMKVDFDVDAVTTEQFNKWEKNIIPYFDKLGLTKTYNKLDEEYGSKGLLADSVARTLGLFYHGDPNSFLNGTHEFDASGNANPSDFLSSLHSLQMSKCHVEAYLKATGNDSGPVVVGIYYSTATLKFEDGKKLMFLNMNAPNPLRIPVNILSENTIWNYRK